MEKSLDKLLDEVRARDITSEQLDEEVTRLVGVTAAKATGDERKRLEEEAAWKIAEINDGGIETQLEYLLEHHEYRWVHEMLVDLR